MAAGKMSNLSFPSTAVGCEFMDEDDWISVTDFLDVKLRFSGFDI